MQYLKEATAVTVKMGPFLDETDQKTAEEALAIAQADIRLSKNGGAFAQTNNVAGATHDEKGWYGVPLDTTDTDTLGTLVVAVHEAGALPVHLEFMVVPANVWDSLFGADMLQVDIREVAAAQATEIADEVLTRGISNVEGAAAFRTLTGAIAKLVNKVGPSGANLITYKTDDATPFGTQAVTTDAGALPITTLDTA